MFFLSSFLINPSLGLLSPEGAKALEALNFLFLFFKSCLTSIYNLSVMTDSNSHFRAPTPWADLHRSAVPFSIFLSSGL